LNLPLEKLFLISLGSMPKLINRTAIAILKIYHFFVKIYNIWQIDQFSVLINRMNKQGIVPEDYFLRSEP